MLLGGMSMRNHLSVTLLTATLMSTAVAGATVVAAPAAAQATPTAGVSAGAAKPATVTAAKPQLIRTKVSFGRCKDTCRIKVRIRNISNKRLFSVALNARLKVNNRKVGSCYDYVGSLGPKRTRWAGCTVRTKTLSAMWNRWLDGGIRWDTYAGTVVSYRYYR